MGHEVACAPNFGLQGGAIIASGTHYYPLYREKIGQDVIPYHCKHWGAELFISLFDLWPYDSEFVARLKTPWAPWFPQDCYPPCATVVERAKQADYPVAMSQFGVDSMAEQGVDCHYIPHGVDTIVYSPGDKAAIRDELKLPQDKFIVLMVAANQSFPSRKAFPENLAGFARFHKEHPDSMLHLHTTRMPRGQMWDGIELDRLIHALGITDAVKFTDEYTMLLGLPDTEMAKLYNAADVLLSASMGEGFGVPCYPAGVRVMTHAGATTIENLTINDVVTTHKGRLRGIIETMNRNVINEPIVRIRAVGDALPQTLTANHPLLAVRTGGRRFISIRRAAKRGEIKPEWIAAGELQVGDMLVAPRRQWTPTQHATIDLGNYTETDGEYLNSKFSNTGGRLANATQVAIAAGVSTHTAQRVLGKYELRHVNKNTQQRVIDAVAETGWKPLHRPSRYLPLTEDTGFLFGQYIAEGWVGQNGQIGFASHTRETGIRARLSQTIKETWGYDTAERIRGNSAELGFTSRSLATAIDRLCGKGAHNKHLPEFIFDNPEFARGVLIGAWLGDGHFGTSASFTTVSEQLAYGMKSLLSALGFYGAMQRNKPRKDFADPEWAITVSGRQLSAFLALFDKTDRTKRLSQRTMEVEDGWWVPIREIERDAYTGTVYNLEVDEDHSYCTEGFASHNCIEAQSCGIPIITTDFSAMPELTFNGVKVKPIQESWIAINTWQAVPPIAGIHQALNIIYEQPAEDKRKAAQAARQKIIQEYSWPIIVEKWRVFLEGVERGEKPSPERLYHVNIKGIEFDAYEDKQSFTLNCVQSELAADNYKFEDVEIRPGDIILDIGAHVGIFAIYAAKKYPEARIIAYEPSATNYDRLIRNLEAAGVTNVEPHNLAVTADGRDIELSYERGNSGGTSALRKVNGHLVEKAKSTTLDTIIDDLSGPFIGEIQRVRFLKIDAEGMEHECLTTTNYLDRVDYLSGEFHINSYLRQQGYSIAELYKHCAEILGPQRVTHTSCVMDE